MTDKELIEQHFKGGMPKKNKDGRYLTYLPNGKQIKRTTLKALKQGVIDYYRSGCKSTVQSIFEEWISFKIKYDCISKSTYDRYTSDYQRFFSNNPYAVKLLDINIQSIDEDMLEYFIRDTINYYSLDIKGWSKLKAIVKCIWLYAGKQKLTDLYVTRFLDMLALSPKVLSKRIEDSSKQVFTDDEAVKILKEIKRRKFSAHNYGIALCFYTGMRAGEISALKWDDISADYRTLSVNHMEVFYKHPTRKGVTIYEVVDHAKTTAGLRTIIIPDSFIPYLKTLKEHTKDCEYMFSVNGKRIHAQNFSDKLANICIQLNITPRRMHKIRKTVCSKLCDSGVDERLLLNQVGHTDKRTTEAFYHKDRRTLEEKIKIINNALAYK